jgi:hypothetical protein
VVAAAPVAAGTHAAGASAGVPAAVATSDGASATTGPSWAIHAVQQYRPAHLDRADQSLQDALAGALREVDQQSQALELGWSARRGEGGWLVDVSVQPRTRTDSARAPRPLWSWWVADDGQLASASEAAAQLTPELPRADLTAAGVS